jgi:predicted ATPase
MSTSGLWRDPLPVERVGRAGDARLREDEWPLTLAPVRQLMAHGLQLGRATVLVGENGTGKSTLVEAIAMAYGLSGEGGSTGARHSTRVTESPLHADLFIQRGLTASRWGYVLRAESMHGLFSYLEDNPSAGREPTFHQLSHGESFLAMLNTNRFAGEGFFVMDEPEAGLSFGSQLALLAVLRDLSGRRGTQLLIATHSPVLAALPGATILQLDDTGINEKCWDELDVVQHQRSFLHSPQRYLRHLD